MVLHVLCIAATKVNFNGCFNGSFALHKNTVIVSNGAGYPCRPILFVIAFINVLPVHKLSLLMCTL